MRYINWDILLFPDGSKVPLQEFKTRCYVTEDPDSSQRKMITPDEFLAPAPTLTCFVPNLENGHPFRVSLHSWEPPVPTPTTEAMAVAQDRVARFEARVLLDGICVAHTLLNQQSSWPQIIDTVTWTDKDGKPGLLRFPRFHEEILTQSWWNAGETMGRIKVIIAEGLGYGLGPASFERTKNIVSFSFQHAPLHVLEDSKVAWPHPGMWCQVPQRLFNLAPPRDYEPNDGNLTRCSLGEAVPGNPTRAKNIDRDLMAQPPSLTFGFKPDFEDSFLPDMFTCPDPVLGDGYDGNSGLCEMPNGLDGANDGNMLDHTRSITPASQNQFDELVASLSVRQGIKGGILAPANTRVSSAANTPFISRASLEATCRMFGHAHRSPWADGDAPPNPKARREPSDMQLESGISEPWLDMIEQPGLRVQMSPTKEVRSRKEGMNRNLEHPLPTRRGALAGEVRRCGEDMHRCGSDARHSGKENREGSAETLIGMGDSKRKRSNTSSDIMLPIRNEGGGSSPMRKVLRTEREEERSRDAFGEM